MHRSLHDVINEVIMANELDGSQPYDSPIYQTFKAYVEQTDDL